MYNLNKISTFLLSLIFLSCASNENGLTLENPFCKIGISDTGHLSSWIDLQSGKNQLSKDSISPLLSIRIQNHIYHPEKASFDKGNETITLQYDKGFSVDIKFQIKEQHFNFEIVKVNPFDSVEMVIWGPYQSTIDGMIGETVGVAQNDEFAIGLQALNPKTLGGYPWTDNDCMPQLNIFDQEDLTDMTEEGKAMVLYRVEAAKPTRYGSSLQAYCRNRNTERIIKNLDHERYISPVYDDGGPVGSKIALFGVPKPQCLETIGKIELAENLPHPMMDGVWTKQHPKAASAYIIMNFGKNNIDKAISITQKAGLQYLYHGGPFQNWGHFDLKSTDFPNGVSDLKYCVDKAAKQDIKLGLHTLSNFITTNDPLVRPLPDPGLAEVGNTVLTIDIDHKQKNIPIQSADFFNQYKNNNLKTVRIRNELIRYEKVSESAPWTLVNCERGAFNTTQAIHQKGDTIRKLIDHGYKVFLTDVNLGEKVAKNIAELFNQTGLRQISFDGLEGNRSTGMGNYGEILFTKTWFDHINEDIKSHYIADASRTSHYFWHIYTRMNWGEPWYAGFRESQTTYRLKNQPYFKRNLMPGMLGWFSMKAETSVEDIEWMLARSAAFDAGYAFVVDYNSLEKNQHTDQILHLIGEWEKLRISGSFNEDQKKLMEDINNEYQLQKKGDKDYHLAHIQSYKFRHRKQIKQPGEPVHREFTFEQKAEESPLNFNIQARNGTVSDIKIEIDHFKEISFPGVLKAGETIKYKGGPHAILYDSFWNKIKEIPVDLADFNLSKGEHKIIVDGGFSNDDKSELAIEIRLVDKDEIIQLKG